MPDGLGHGHPVWIGIEGEVIAGDHQPAAERLPEHGAAQQGQQPYRESVRVPAEG
jgi:hypothetical protein